LPGRFGVAFMIRAAPQADMFSLLAPAPTMPAAPPATVTIPAFLRPAETFPPFLEPGNADLPPAAEAIAALAGLTVLEDLPGGDRVALGPVGWAQAFTVMTRLKRILFALPIDQRPLPSPWGIVLEHLDKLDLFRVSIRLDGGVVVPLPIYAAARDAAAVLRSAFPQEENSDAA
jgi:hypothetical protein